MNFAFYVLSNRCIYMIFHHKVIKYSQTSVSLFILLNCSPVKLEKNLVLVISPTIYGVIISEAQREKKNGE